MQPPTTPATPGPAGAGPPEVAPGDDAPGRDAGPGGARRRWAARAHALDDRAFTWVARRRARGWDGLLIRLSRSGDFGQVWLAVAAVAAAAGGPRGRRAALAGLASLGSTAVLVNGPMKLVARRARPVPAVVPEHRRPPRPPRTTSFPSGHAATSVAFVTGVARRWPALGLALAPLAVAMGYSRVHTGVHYPADVVAGAVCGLGIGLATPEPARLVLPETAPRGRRRPRRVRSVRRWGERRSVRVARPLRRPRRG